MNNDQEIINEINSLPEDFWDFRNADTKDLTHGIHYYPAMMIYPISRKFISIVTKYKKIDSIFDPFMGSGTVILEGQLAGIENVIGNDLNPLALLITKVKTTIFDLDILSSELTKLNNELENFYIANSEAINSFHDYVVDSLRCDIYAKGHWSQEAPSIINRYFADHSFNFRLEQISNIGYWFKPKALLEVLILRHFVETIENQEVRDFVLLALSEVLRLVSNRRNSEFKMYRMEVSKLQNFDPNVLEVFKDKLNINYKMCEKFNTIVKVKSPLSKIKLISNDATNLRDVKDNTIDLVITSPPYGDSRTTVAYGEFSRLSLQLLRLDNENNVLVGNLDSELLGGKRKVRPNLIEIGSQTLSDTIGRISSVDKARAQEVLDFYIDLDLCIKSISQKMKKNGYQFWVVGNRTVKLNLLKTDVILNELSKKHDLIHVHTFDRLIPNKVMPLKNSPSNVAGEKVTTMTSEKIVIFRKQ